MRFSRSEGAKARFPVLRLGMLAVIAATSTIIAVQAAAGAGAVTISGDQLIAGASSCPGADSGTYRMAGELVGCWYTDTFVVLKQKDNAGGEYKASGAEHFTGCLNGNGNDTCDPGEPYGTFYTTFTYTAKLAPTGDEIHGRCHHPIVGTGTGAFVNATGVISFKDIPTEGRFPYHGTISY